MNKYKIVISVFLIFTLGFFTTLSSMGWGYAGYSRRHYYRPSWFYMRSAGFYPNRDLRSGSIGGKGVRGGGPGSGK
jgi:hypothetical protein